MAHTSEGSELLHAPLHVWVNSRIPQNAACTCRSSQAMCVRSLHRAHSNLPGPVPHTLAGTELPEAQPRSRASRAARTGALLGSTSFPASAARRNARKIVARTELPTWCVLLRRRKLPSTLYIVSRNTPFTLCGIKNVRLQLDLRLCCAWSGRNKTSVVQPSILRSRILVNYRNYQNVF